MWYFIDSNKRKTWILLTLMVLLLLFFGTSLSVLSCGFELTSCVIGLSISAISAVMIIFYTKSQGSKFFLDQIKAVPIDPYSGSVVKNIVEEMAIASSLGFVPKVYITESKIPNAFAVGINSKNSAIVVTTGLLSLLNRDELQAVIAHETSHIKNQDTLYLMYAGVIFGIIVTISDGLLRGLSRSSRNSSKGSGAVAIFILLLAILSPICARLLYFSLSRKREFLADACACQYTRYPMALASALKKISSYSYVEGKKGDIEKDEIVKSGKIVSCMYIHNNLQKRARNFFTNLFQTHPPIEKRIEVLSKMSSADLDEYVNVFARTVSEKKALIPKSALKSMNIVPLAIVASKLDDGTNEDKIIRQRQAKDEYKKAKKYNLIKCDCGTILKIPPEFPKKSVSCPHCKKVHEF